MARKPSFLERLLRRQLPSSTENRPIKRLSLSKFPTAIYAVGDVHGCYDLYRALETIIVKDGAGQAGPKLIVLLGDIVDRGPQSSARIDYLLAPAPPGFQRVILMGNHEDMMLQFLNAPSYNRSWLEFGGRETLLSYGMEPDADVGFTLPDMRLKQMFETCIPQSHRTLLEQLPVCLSVGKYLFSHAGYDAAKTIAGQGKNDLIWGDPALLDTHPGAMFAVHGHVSVDEVLITDARMNVDTGAYASGKLSAVKITPDGDYQIFTSCTEN